MYSYINNEEKEVSIPGRCTQTDNEDECGQGYHGHHWSIDLHNPIKRWLDNYSIIIIGTRREITLKNLDQDT